MGGGRNGDAGGEGEGGERRVAMGRRARCVWRRVGTGSRRGAGRHARAVALCRRSLASWHIEGGGGFPRDVGQLPTAGAGRARLRSRRARRTLCVAMRTRPNEPVPRVTPTVKSARDEPVGSRHEAIARCKCKLLRCGDLTKNGRAFFSGYSSGTSSVLECTRSLFSRYFALPASAGQNGL